MAQEKHKLTASVYHLNASIMHLPLQETSKAVSNLSPNKDSQQVRCKSIKWVSSCFRITPIYFEKKNSDGSESCNPERNCIHPCLSEFAVAMDKQLCMFHCAHVNRSGSRGWLRRSWSHFSQPLDSSFKHPSETTRPRPKNALNRSTLYNLKSQDGKLIFQDFNDE